MSANPFDEFKPAPSPFDEFQEAVPQRAVLKAAVVADPDKTAEAARLARRYPAPVDSVVRNLENYQLQEVVDKADERLKTSPVLAKALKDKPFLAKIAHDDIDRLAELGQFVSDLGGAAKAGVFRASRGAAGTFRAGLELAAPVLDIFEPGAPGAPFGANIPLPGGNPIRRLAEGFGIQAEGAGRTAEAARPKTEGDLSAGFFSGIESFVQNLLYLPMALTPGGAPAALAGMTQSTGGDAYQTAREKGLGVTQAVPYAASQAAIEYATEKLPLTKLIGDVKAGTPFLQTLVKQMGLEIPGEQVATILQDLNDWAVLNPGKPFADYLAERPSAAAQTLVATIVGVGGNVSTVKTIEAAVNRLTRDGANMQRAGVTAQALEKAMKGAEASALRERAPEEFRELLTQMADDGKVYLDAEVAATLPGELLEQAGLTQEVADAVQMGGSVAIPIADALTYLPGTSHADVFLQNARSAPDAPNLLEAEEAGKQASQLLATEYENVVKQAQDQEAARREFEAVRADLAQQIAATGRYRPNVAETYATGLAHFFAAYGSRTGLGTQGLYQAYRDRGFGIRGEPSTQGGELVDQPAYHGSPHHGIEQFTTQKIGTGEGAQAYGWGMYFAGNKEIAEFYRKALTKHETFIDGKPVDKADPRFGAIMSIAAQGYDQYVANTKLAIEKGFFEKGYGERLLAKAETLKNAKIEQRKEAGQTYTVEVPDDNDLLDYDAPLSEQPEKVRKAVESLGIPSRVFMVLDKDTSLPHGEYETLDQARRKITQNNWTATIESAGNVIPGREVYEKLNKKHGSPEAASLALRDAGIPGLRYLDAGSRGANKEDRTHNYVIFDDSAVRKTGELYQTDGFERWVGDATRVDIGEAHEFKAGEPVVVAALHGTTGDFTEFDRSMVNIESDLGGGFYFTNSPDDVGFNYAGLGPDLTQKIELEAERLESNEDLDRDEAKRIARDKWMANEGLTLPVWVKFTNPVVLGGQNETFLRYEESYDEETEEYGEPEGDLVKVVEALREVLSDERYGDADVDQVVADIMDAALDNGGLTARELIQKAKLSEGLVYAADYENDGELASTEVLRRAFEEAGFDGVIDTTVNEKFGTERQRGKAMEGMDENTVHFIAFEPTQIKSRLGNDGSFDANDPSILSQKARGTFNPKTLELVLSPNTDLSTLWHEMGHFFLEVLADVATQPNAPEQIAADYTTVLNWFGVTHEQWAGFSLDQKRKYHERWAESIEQYVMEGKVPNREMAPLMRRFSAWLKSVYGSIKQFLADRQGAQGMAINDDIRRVIDRMLATDEQIAQAEEVAGLLPDEDATGQAEDRLRKRSMADLKWTVRARDKVIKELQKKAAATRKQIEAEVTAEANALPAFAAKDALAKLEKQHEKDPFSADMNTATVADAYGFETVDAMHRAIEQAGERQDYIDGRTEQRMLEEHGDLMNDDAIRAAANEAVHNEARARSLATELRTQGEMLNPRQDTGEKNAKGQRVTVNALIEAAKQFAANVVGRTPIRDLKNRAWQHTAAERRAGKAWQQATAAGKTQDAVKAKQDQVLNNAAAKAAIEAQAEVKKTLEFFARVTKGNDEKVVDKGRDPDIVNAARAVLAMYGVQTPASKNAAEYLEAVKRNDPDAWSSIEPMVQAAAQSAQPLESLTVDELAGLREQIEGMWYLAKRSRQMEVDGDLMDIEDAAQELHGRLEAIGIPVEIPGERGALTEKEQRTRGIRFFGAALKRVEQWAEGMDGKYGGPFLRYVFQPVKDAADRYRADRTKYRKKFQALVNKIAPSMRHELIEAPELGYTFGRGHNGIGTAELLHALLHTGNDSNKRKLLLGRGWAVEGPNGELDTTQWDAFIERMVNEGKLTQAHYDFLQGVWDLMEEVKPLAQKAHRDVFGRYFDEVTATPFETPFGSYRGGYVPAQADPEITPDATLRELAERENESMAYSFPATNKGFTKSRVEYNRPLKLDLRTLPQHLDKVLLFSHMEPAVRGASKLLRNKGVSQPLNRIDPTAYAGTLLPWLNRSAKQVVETPVMGDGKITRVLSVLRARAGAALMFANVSNTVQQITGLSTAAIKVKPGHLLRAAAQYIAHPKATSQAVWDASPYMDDRAKNEVAAMNEQLEAILLNPSAYKRAQTWTQRHAYFLQTAFDNVLSPIVWTGAYNQAVEEGMDEDHAVKFADGVVRQTQGSTLPEDVSRIETGPAYARMFTQFVGYFNMIANTNATALKQIAQETGLKKGAGKALYVTLMGLLMPIWIAEAVAQAFRGGPPDDDDDGYLDDWIAAVLGMGTIKGLLAGVPFVGQLANAGINRANNNPADDKMSLSPAVSLLEGAAGAPVSTYKAIVEEGSARKAIRDVASLVSLATGLPATAAARPLGYAADVTQGRITPTGPSDAARGLVTGSASPDSR